jgi:transcriptional regulator with XRE-family HTH domain
LKNPIAVQFGENLRRARKRADLSQEELSVMASVHRTEISYLERALRLPRLDTLVKLAACLDVGTDELLVGIVWQPGEVRRGGFRASGEDSGGDDAGDA